jgi:hypothetical protein
MTFDKTAYQKEYMKNRRLERDPARELERLTAFLEKALGHENVKIESPARIHDKDTGQIREVDVSIKGKLGSSNVFVIVECRNRNRVEDVQWIEQVAQKMKSVGADKALAVSSTGFTGPAQDKANSLGVRLMVLGKVEPQEISSWMQLTHTRSIIHQWNPKNINIIPAPPKDALFLTALRKKQVLGTNEKIFRREKDGVLVSLDEIWGGQCAPEELKKNKLYDGVEPNGPKVERSVRFDFVKDDGFQWATKKGGANLTTIEITADIWIEEKLFPIKEIYRYSEDGKAYIESVRVEFEVNGERKEFILNMDMNTRRVSLVMDKPGDKSKLKL